MAAASLLPASVLADPGDVDLSFNIGTGPNGIVSAIKVRTNDSKIYLGGTFDLFNGTRVNRIARLFRTGALDTTFVTPGVDSTVRVIVVQPDLKCVIGGYFGFVGNTSSPRLARLGDDGTLDTAFTTNIGTGADGGVEAMALQSDGKILIGGDFFNINGVPRLRIARLNADGSLDTSFLPGLGPDQSVRSINVQPDGNILVCGSFATFNGLPRLGLVRLLPNGSVDTSFNIGTGGSGIYGTAIQPDGKIIVFGSVLSFNNVVCSRIFRVNASGSRDLTYAASGNIGSDVNGVELMPSGKALIVGVFDTVSGTSRRGVARLDLNGAHDTQFNPGTGAGFLTSGSSAGVTASALDTDGKLLISGAFTQFNNIPYNFLTRINTADPTPPLIITHPVDVFIPTGSNATFSVTASGTDPFTYQWRFGGVNISGATNISITITNAQNANVGLYSIVVANSAGTATSSNASLTLGTFPFFVTPPQSITNIVGANVSFSVTAGGTTPLFYQWLFNGTVLSGQNNPTLNLANIQVGNDGPYTIIVSNLFGAVTNVATLTVAAPPAIVFGPNGGGPDGQPQSLTVLQGQNATFSANAVGSAPLTYQWRFAGVNISGATGTSLTLTNTQTSQAGLYSVVISNPFGTTTSANATLTVLVPPIITPGPGGGGPDGQPQSLTVLQGQNATFSANAIGTAPLSYQWRFAGVNIPGAINASVTLLNVVPSQAGLYSVVISNPGGTTTSANATLTVLTPPIITPGPNGGGPDGHPQSLTVLQGQNATFSVNAIGTAPLTYQWRFAEVNISGATNTSVTLTNVLTSQAGLYSVVISNSGGSTTSSNATLTVIVPPMITPGPGGGGPDGQPQSLTVVQGQNATFSANAIGTAPLAYQWRFAGVNIPGANGPAITLTNVVPSQAGLYSVVISNTGGTATSANATLTVLTPPVITPGPNGGGPDGHPQSLTVVQGQNATFSVNAIGTAPLTYQWRLAGVNIAGATSTSITLNNVLASQASLYSVVISNSGGSTTSSNATLTVLLPPTIIVPPVSQTLTQGATLNLSVTASGSPTLTYQWRFNGLAFPGATSPFLSLLNVQESSEGNYTVVVSNPYGSVTSVVAVVTIQSPPNIFDAGQPQPQTVIQGNTATFSVTASGDLPFTYQWRVGGVNLPGATSNPLVLTGVQTNQAGNYSVVVSNPFGSAISSNALLTVRVPPFIITQPTPAVQTVVVGSTATIAVVAGGDPTLTYQWQLNGVNIPGAIAATLTLANVQPNQLGSYTVVVSNPYGTVTSGFATLIVKSPPSVATQPQSLTVIQGSPASFSVTAGGDGPFTYQWRFGGVNIAGATTPSVGLASALTNDAGLYSVVISSPYGSVTSSNALLTVRVPPFIITQPAPATQSVIAGGNAAITVVAGGDPTLTYQWRLNGVNVTGATAPTLTLVGVQANQLGSYTVVVSNPYGTVTSSAATLDVKSPPSVASHPQSLTILKGTSATFSVTAGGDGPFTYQWRFAGVNLSGATANPLTLTNVQTNQAGLYSVVITSPYGSVTSSNATLTVLDPPVIVVQPVSVSALAGESVTFLVVATGRPTLRYQWCKNDTVIAGATNVTLTLTNVSASDVASYNVKVTNSDGNATSQFATFTLSTRTLQVVTTQTTSQTTNFTAGGPISVPVALLAEGGENRVLGSVAYDTNKLVFVNVTTPLGATLTSTNTASGQIGFDLALPGAQTFTAGSNVVAFLNFTIGISVTQSIASLMLQGEPVTNQVLNAAGAPLPCFFRSGVLIFKSLAAYELQSQTGATEEALPILNPAGSLSAVSFLRISFFDLGVDSLGNAIYLLNATSTNNGVPFILLPIAIAPAGSFPLNVDYYVSDRITKPQPRLVVEVVTDGYPVAPAGTVLSLDRTSFNQGRVTLDFLSRAGKTYYIQYSASAAGPYDTSFPGIVGTGGPLQWVDTGPPRTSSLPTAAGTRFYRLLQVP